MTEVLLSLLLSLLLAAPVLLVAGGPASVRGQNGSVPLVLWHGMGEWFCFQQLNANKIYLLRVRHLMQLMDLSLTSFFFKF